MIRIRLTRVGKKNSPLYRVVVADQRKAVKRKFIEIVGHYNPTSNPKTIVINKERAIFWMSQGAQPSDTVRNLMCDLEYLPKDQKAKKVFGKEQTKKQIKEGVGKEEPVSEKTEEKVEAKEETSEEASNTSEEVPAETEAEIEADVEAEEADVEAETLVEETADEAEAVETEVKTEENEVKTEVAKADKEKK